MDTWTVEADERERGRRKRIRFGSAGKRSIVLNAPASRKSSARGWRGAVEESEACRGSGCSSRAFERRRPGEASTVPPASDRAGAVDPKQSEAIEARVEMTVGVKKRARNL